MLRSGDLEVSMDRKRSLGLSDQQKEAGCDCASLSLMGEAANKQVDLDCWWLVFLCLFFLQQFSCAFISKKLCCRTTKWWLYLSTLTTQRRGEIQERETDWWSAFLWLLSGWTDGQEHLTFLACQAGKHALAWQHRCICDERLHEIEYAQVSNGGVRCCWLATYEVLEESNVLKL